MEVCSEASYSELEASTFNKSISATVSTMDSSATENTTDDCGDTYQDTMDATTREPTTESQEKSVCSFYLEGRCRFGEECFYLHPHDAVVKVPEKKPTRKTKTRKAPREEEYTPKKPSMKTAGDVRHRIQWDENLKEEYFTVGYVDRFCGVVEKPFTSFFWGDLALADEDQLAIPQHRIQYFKYKGTKVWDKAERLDHVFGSAGTGVKIMEKIEEVDEELERRARLFNPDEDSDDEDFVTLGGDGEVASGLVSSICDVERPKPELLRATHFLCIKVKDEFVKSKAAEVQEHVIREDPVLRSCAMPSELLHVTLAMVRCDTPEAVLEVDNILKELRAEIQDLVGGWEEGNPQRRLKARGLSTFGARVLYVKVDVPAAFMTLIEVLHKALRHVKDVTITNHFEYVPHMTLLKVNRATARERRSKYLNSILYSDYIDQDFGAIALDNIHFCVIDDVRGPDGFYVTCKNIRF